MLGLIATLRVKQGSAQQFEEVFTSLASAVRANEPGNLLFQLTRCRDVDNTYKAMELYRDEDALQAHRAAEHSKVIGKQLGPLLAGRPEVEILDAVI